MDEEIMNYGMYRRVFNENVLEKPSFIQSLLEKIFVREYKVRRYSKIYIDLCVPDEMKKYYKGKHKVVIVNLKNEMRYGGYDALLFRQICKLIAEEKIKNNKENNNE